MDVLDLGLPGVGEVGPGTHFCALYSGPAERDRLLFSFLDAGLRHGDKCLCLVDDIEPALVRDHLVGRPGPEYSRRSSQLEVKRASEAYLPTGEFRIDDMARFLIQSVGEATDAHFGLLRAAGEMSWVLPGPPGHEDLFDYESALNGVVDQMPALFMCLYDLNKFGVAMLIEALRTHPKVLLDRTVIDNPHYVPPAAYVRPEAAVPEHTSEPEPGPADGGDDRRWESLTEGELRVVTGVAQGLTNRDIAARLHLSRHTVDAHLKHVFLKLDIHTRVELTVWALKHGVLDSRS